MRQKRIRGGKERIQYQEKGDRQQGKTYVQNNGKIVDVEMVNINKKERYMYGKRRGGGGGFGE